MCINLWFVMVWIWTKKDGRDGVHVQFWDRWTNTLRGVEV